MFAALAALALATSLAAGTDRVASPTTWAALQGSLPEDKARRTQALLRFAHDDDPAHGPSVADRKKAARAAKALLAKSDARRIDVALLLATLAAVDGKPKERKAALAEARALAKQKRLEKARRLDEAMNAEAALAVLSSSLTKRARRTASAPGPLEDKAAGVVENALPAWLALGDERQHAAALVVLAERARLAGDAAQAERMLSDAVDALGAKGSRDTAGVRADAWRGLARLFEAAARWEEAASAALAADRALAEARAPTPTDGAYVRSKDSARLCKAARAQGVSCARLERARWGARTYYDFSAERGRRGAFDAARADDVLAEYESELHECLRQGAKANLTTDTHVELVWTVGNDGRVPPTAELSPSRLRGTSVEACVREAFALFRYPPYAGELQHVRLSFDVGS